MELKDKISEIIMTVYYIGKHHKDHSEAIKDIAVDRIMELIGEEYSKKRCHVCGVLEGEPHKGICSVGNGIYRG